MSQFENLKMRNNKKTALKFERLLNYKSNEIIISIISLLQAHTH
jgi:hypothetical protein